MAQFKVVLTDTTAADYAIERQMLEASGLDLRCMYLQTREPAQVLEQAVDADAIVLAWASMTRPVIEHLRRCRVIARYGIGVDMIDLDAATERGIIVCNTARYCIDEVSNQTLAFVLMLNRDLPRQLDAVRTQGWSPPGAPLPRRLSGQQFGLIGLGNIGRAVAAKAQSFGLRIAAFDPYLEPHWMDLPTVSLMSLPELLRTSDFISIHCPLTPTTRHLLGEGELALMKPTAFLINTARGPIVDQAALTRALAERRIAGAALDVFEQEPLPADDPLRRLETVILTPHAASWSVEASEECRRTAVAHVLTVLGGGVPPDVVNRAVLQRGLQA